MGDKRFTGDMTLKLALGRQAEDPQTSKGGREGVGWEGHSRSGMHMCKKKGIKGFKGFREQRAFFCGWNCRPWVEMSLDRWVTARWQEALFSWEALKNLRFLSAIPLHPHPAVNQ